MKINTTESVADAPGISTGRVPNPTERELVGRFILTTFEPGSTLAPAHVEMIGAAQERLRRYARQAREAAKKAGRPRSKDPGPAALAKRRERERKKAGK